MSSRLSEMSDKLEAALLYCQKYQQERSGEPGEPRTVTVDTEEIREHVGFVIDLISCLGLVDGIHCHPEIARTKVGAMAGLIFRIFRLGLAEGEKRGGVKE